MRLKKKELRTPATALLIFTAFFFASFVSAVVFASFVARPNYLYIALDCVLPFAYAVWLYVMVTQPGVDALDEKYRDPIQMISAALLVWNAFRMVTMLISARFNVLYAGPTFIASLVQICTYGLLVLVARSKDGGKVKWNYRGALLMGAWGFMALYVVVIILRSGTAGDLVSTLYGMLMFLVVAFFVWYFCYVKPRAKKVASMTAAELEADTQKRERWRLYYFWVPGLAFLITSFAAGLSPWERQMMFTFGFGGLCVAVIMTIGHFRKKKVERHELVDIPSEWPKDCFYADYAKGVGSIENKQKLASGKELNFYQACVGAGVRSLDGAANMARAKLVAGSKGIQDDEASIRSAFEAGQKMAQDNKKALENRVDPAKDRKMRVEELELLKETLRFYGLEGREKRKQMLTAMVAEAKGDVKAAEYGAWRVQETTQQKELDWGILGGIADGFAGFGAGVAVAMDVQMHNAQVREQNRQNLPVTMAGITYFQGKQQDAQKRIVSLQGEISALPHKLVAEDSAADVFSHIIIEDPTCSTTETGAVVVEATFSVDPNYRIYDTVKPVIDGCIAARILRGTERIGSVYFVLPTYGVDSPCRLKAICTKTTGMHATYSVRFEPQYLWAMEK